MTDRPSVLFVCVHNAGRSQMAAGWLTHLAGDRIEVRSAGSEPADQINPVAVAAMAEVVVEADLERQRFQECIDIADIILEHDPTSVYMSAKRGSAFADQIETEFVQKYPRPIDIPPALRPRFWPSSPRRSTESDAGL